MSGKEERIIIAAAEPSLLEGGADKIYPCMTRQEAIRRIARIYGCGHKAKAAINALLEGEKNENK